MAKNTSHPYEYNRGKKELIEDSRRKKIEGLKNPISKKTGVKSTAFRLPKILAPESFVKVTPIRYGHLAGYNAEMVWLFLQTSGRLDKLNINILFSNFTDAMQGISHAADKSFAAGETDELNTLYKHLGELRYSSPKDVSDAIENIKKSYDNKYQDEKSKERREAAYQTLLADLKQRLDVANVTWRYLTYNSPMEGRLQNEVAPGSILQSFGSPYWDGAKVDIVCGEKGGFVIASGASAKKVDRIAAVEAVIETIANQQRNKGNSKDGYEISGTISINIDDREKESDAKEIAEQAYIQARLQGFEPQQISVKYNGQSFHHRYDELEAEISRLKPAIKEAVINALDPQHPNLPNIPDTDSFAIESSSSDGKANKPRTVKATLANRTPLSAALASSREDEETKTPDKQAAGNDVITNAKPAQSPAGNDVITNAKPAQSPTGNDVITNAKPAQSPAGKNNVITNAKLAQPPAGKNNVITNAKPAQPPAGKNNVITNATPGCPTPKF
jgi:hypothetical protein